MNLLQLKILQLKETKNILKLAESAVYRRIMTGSPVTKKPIRFIYTM